MESFPEIARQIVLCLFTPLLGACALAWVLLQLPSPCSRKRSKLGRSVCAGLVSLAVVCTALIGKNTNGVNGVGTGTTGILPVATVANGHAVSTGGTPVVPVVVTQEDISNGWRVTEVSDAGAFAQPPANAVTNGRWRLRGAHDDAFRIPADGWSYPFASGVTVLSRGEIRKDIRSRDFPRAFEQDLSLLPLVNWQLLPDGRTESVFWHGTTSSNTLIATWWNAALGRDATNPVCFQAELYTNGGFDYRYEDRTVRHLRVWPFDLDDDGLENTVDPDPFVVGPDAHGTNAEWYNVVCSNVFFSVEGGTTGTTGILPVENGGTGTTGILPVGDDCVLSWCDGVNSNAYYFVDVVASNGPAPIYFTGDRESRLGNPVVVARGGETNHVPLLIGINYAVTSPVPFSVSFPDDGFATITTNDVSNYEVRWPLEFTVAPDGIGYRVSAVPYDPGCVFQWAEPTRSVACSYTTDGGWIGFNCCGIGVCGCSGCAVTGVATLESASFDLPSVWCGCWHFDPLEPGYGMFQTNTPSVSVSFDKSVVFYEDAYTNAPNDVVAKHSTNTTLTVFACGGESGGTLYVTAQNIGKLSRTGGSEIDFPYVAFVPPHGCVSFSITYAAETHSDSEGDIFVSAAIFPHEGEIVSDSAAVTAVKVLLEARYGAPVDGNKLRHKYGVREEVFCKHLPEALPVLWSSYYGDFKDTGNAVAVFTAPMNGGECTLAISANYETYMMKCSILEPEKFYCERVSKMDFGLGTNIAGGVGMSLELYIEPLTVSFGNIALQEVPTDTGQVWGYFLNNDFSHMWAHTRDNRAGQWNNVGGGQSFHA